MRVVFVSAPFTGHLDPMIPLALELVAAGHEVEVATAPDLGKRITRLGLVPLAAGTPRPELYAELGRRIDRSDRSRDRLNKDIILFVELIAAPMVADLMAALSDSPPDLIVHDPAAYAGPLVARLLGIPSVCHHFSAPPRGPEMEEFNKIVDQSVRPLWDQWGCPPRPMGGVYDYLVLCLWPPTLWSPDAEGFPTARRIRPTWSGGSSDEPSWVTELEGQPTVYVSFGTSFGYIELFRTVLAALDRDSLNAIVTVGPGVDPAELGPTRPNIHVERFIPQSVVLPHCNLVVCHGGAGTMLGALAYGLPLLCIPLGGDHFFNADSCKAAGVARVLEVSESNHLSVGQEIRTLLDDPDYRRRAEIIKAEIDSMPLPAQWVPHLETLALERTLSLSPENG